MRTAQRWIPLRCASCCARQLQKNEADSVIEAYNSLDTVNMPAGNTIWRLSNAVSWVAGKTEDAERKQKISKVAGQILNPA